MQFTNIGFNSAKYDLNFKKSFLLPILLDERDIEPAVTKKATHFISFKYSILGINIPGGASHLDSTLKAPKTSETKRSFTYEQFDHPDKIQEAEIPLYEAL